MPEDAECEKGSGLAEQSIKKPHGPPLQKSEPPESLQRVLRGHVVVPGIKARQNKSARCSHGQTLRQQNKSFRRIMLLVVAITIHNFPEGLAVGVGFGSVGKPNGMKFKDAIILAWGIGLQNFPEGLAVSLPLYREGMSMWKSFFYGQLSGMSSHLLG